ncbi:phosphatidylcholine/phosphatidylserine synthase [Sphingomonas parva]|uniref:Phosphatidylcholine synthase n=1 Tax=Sphingomonas parva TaxID=2555898 RepID=A0A4Y8ZNZ8_9SPHN|nr:CDP-alcohol phosphatidyltransferase family protein [Sphingomonas parva]TFI56992.1 phosphatidylcholine/phosphatidylserine synthase [Sphingomonas parva]
MDSEDRTATRQPATVAGGEGPPAVFAWLVHLFTASGAVLALLALIEVDRARWHWALFWLFVAVVVDGIDGTFARWARTRERAARIDGDTLDLVVDYLTYVFVPTIFIWRAGLVPADHAPWLAAAIQFSSLYLFARRDMKTDDNYFRGFPALWNIVAFYLFVIDGTPLTGLFVVALLVALTFAPVHFVHPFRVRDYGKWLPLITTVWAVSTVSLLWLGPPSTARSVCLTVSVATAAILLLLGVVRSVRGPREAAPGDRLTSRPR